MKGTPEKGDRPHRAPRRLIAIAAMVLAVTQACLTIRGMGIEGFVLWVLILFVGYWLFFNFLLWLVRKIRDRA